MSANSMLVTWEKFWAELPRGSGQAIWDGNPDRNVALDLDRFSKKIVPELPMLDVGCGNGTQTVYLAAHLPHVIGLDFSASAVGAAQASFPGGPARFQQFDLLDRMAADELHDQLGDCNIYIRTVLHNIPADRRPDAIANLNRLMGDKGVLYAIELSPQAGEVFDAAATDGLDRVPKLKRVLDYNVIADQFTIEDFKTLLEHEGLVVAESGTSSVQSAEKSPDGTLLEVPSQYVLARRGDGGRSSTHDPNHGQVGADEK